MSPFFTPFKIKSPSKPVMIPFVVPFTTTEAPTTGPNSSDTTPFTSTPSETTFTTKPGVFKEASSAYNYGDEASNIEHVTPITFTVLGSRKSVRLKFSILTKIYLLLIWPFPMQPGFSFNK